MTDGGRQYVVAGPWRRRSDIVELIEISPGKRRAELLEAVTGALIARGTRLLILDVGPYSVDRGLVRAADLVSVERIVEYERADCRVAPRASTLEIRPYVPSDRDAVLALERRSFPWLWWNSQDEWDAYVATPEVDVIVGFERGRMVGYAGTTCYRREGHLDRLAVQEADQGKGFGAALLVEALARLDRAGARRVRLTTQEDNVRSQALYERYGFRRGRWVYEIFGKWLSQPEGPDR